MTGRQRKQGGAGARRGGAAEPKKAGAKSSAAKTAGATGRGVKAPSARKAASAGGRASGPTRTEIQAARYVLIVSMLFLTLLGLLMIFSASSVTDYVKEPHDALHHLKRQLVFIAAGALLLCGALLWDLKRSRTLVSWGLLALSDLGLLVVLTPLGVGKWGAQRWIDVGPFTIQPSEWAKLGAMLAVAHTISEYHAGRIDLTTAAKRVGYALVPPVVLVMLQPDMGTTVSIVLAVLVVLVLGGFRFRYLLGMGAAGIGLGAAAIAFEPYRLARFIAFVDPWADPKGGGYQAIQALYAFASGGLFGVGLGMSRQKFFYLPAAHTDFIFAIVGEELGLIGALAVVVAFGAMLWAGLRIAAGMNDTYGRLVAGGLTATIVLQAAMNMSAVTGLMPVTGIPLPLVSYGGSSATFTMACIGIVLAAARAAERRTGKGRTEEVLEDSAIDREWRRDRRPHLSSIDGGRAAVRRRA